MKKIIALIIITWFSLFIVSGCTGTSAEENILNAEKAIKEKKYKRAVIELKNSLRKSPKNIKARLLLGKAYLVMDDGVSAEKEFSRYFQYGGADQGVKVLVARALLQQKKYLEIIKVYEKTKGKVDDAEYMSTVAQAYLGENRLTEASNLFNKILEQKPRFTDAELGLAKIDYLNNDISNAIAKLKNIISLNKDEPRAWLWLGQIYQKNNNVEDALNAYKNAADMYDGITYGVDAFTTRYAYLGLLLSKEKYDLASVQIKKLSRAYPGHPLVIYISALHDYLTKNYDASETKLYKVVKLTPNNMPAILLLGAIHDIKGNYEQANELLSRYVAKMPLHLEARKLLASVRIKLNRQSEALGVLTAIDPVNYDTRTIDAIGRLALNSGDLGNGIRQLKRVVTQSPDNVRLRNALAVAYIKSGHYDLAIKEISGMSGDARNKAAYTLIEAFLAKGEYQKAEDEVNRLLKAEPGSPGALAAAGIVALRGKDQIKARSFFEKSLKAGGGDYIPALLLLAKLELANNELQKAAKRFDHILLKQTSNISAHLGLFEIAIRQGRSADAVSLLNKAHQKNPSDKRPVITLANYYLSTGESKKAIDMLQKTRAIHKSDIDLGVMLARALINSNQKMAALTVYQELLEMNPGKPFLYLATANLQLDLKEYNQARAVINRAITKFPQNNLFKGAMSIVESRAGNVDEALLLARRIQASKKTSSIGYVLEGDIYLDRKQYKQARQLYKKALLENDNRKVLYKLYLAYRRDGKNNDGMNALKSWVEKHPTDITVLFDLANLRVESGETATAIKLYRKLLELNQAHIGALNNLANVYIDTDPSLALEYAKKAIALQPDSAALQDTLGWVYYKQGRNKALALEYIEKASKRSADPSIKYHLAVLHEEMGKKDSARLILEKLTSSNKKFPEYKQSLEMLSRLKNKI